MQSFPKATFASGTRSLIGSAPGRLAASNSQDCTKQRVQDDMTTTTQPHNPQVHALSVCVCAHKITTALHTDPGWEGVAATSSLLVAANMAVLPVTDHYKKHHGWK